MGAETIAVADAGPILHLNEIDLIELLNIWNQLLIPKAVWAETAGAQRIPATILATLKGLTVRQVTPENLEQFIRQFHLEALHAGERECLYLCKNEDVSLLLTDDLAVRRAAKRLGIRPVGSLGVIVRGYRLGKLSLLEARTYLRALQHASSLFVTPEIVEIAIRQLE